MLFNSTVFVAFFILVYGTYVATRSHRRIQNVVLLLAGYVFYGYWDVRFLSLLLLSTVIDFFIAKAIHSSDSSRRRRFLIVTSVSAQLAILGIFKYFNFFADTVVRVFDLLGFAADPITLRITLPVGVSFYTFQTISYTVDVYRRKLTPATNFLDFALFVSFFPQLVAGPIERAGHMLPQVTSARTLSYERINRGLFLLLWGYFQKMVVADRMASLVNPVFGNHHAYHGADLSIAVVAFAFQVYGDFAGYSNIARGLASLMGFELMLNFDLPYFARTPSDFWMRWHISLSNWLRDYLFLPLSYAFSRRLDGVRWLGVRDDAWIYACATSVTMLLGGLWHGAAWTFVIWGGYQGLLLSAYRVVDVRRRRARSRSLRRLRVAPGIQIVVMFAFTLVGWVMFRSKSLEQIAYFLLNGGIRPTAATAESAYRLAFFVLPMLGLEAWQFRAGDLFVVLRQPALTRLAVYCALLTWIGVFGVRSSLQFIYFQF